jgi:hypothetical protein
MRDGFRRPGPPHTVVWVFVTRQTEKSTTGRARLCCAQPDPTGLDGKPGSHTEDPGGRTNSASR